MIPRLFLSLLLMLGVAVLAQVPQGTPTPNGVLRLNWKTEGEKILIKADANNDNLPAHMRAQSDFEEKMRDYKLTATVDDKPWLDKLMRPPGFNHDRPISVFEELSLPPGQHKVKVSFLPSPAEGASWKPEIDQVVTIEPGVIITLAIGEPPSKLDSNQDEADDTDYQEKSQEQ